MRIGEMPSARAKICHGVRASGDVVVNGNVAMEALVV